MTCFDHANSTCHLDLQHTGDFLTLEFFWGGRIEPFMYVYVMYVGSGSDSFSIMCNFYSGSPSGVSFFFHFDSGVLRLVVAMLH